MKFLVLFLVACVAFANADIGPPTDEPPPPETEAPITEEPPPTEPPVVTEKPKKCHCICQWKKCKATVESPEGSKQCYAELRTCTQKKCDTTVCDTALAACQEKGAKKGKHGLKCDKQWKKCFKQHRSQICKKKGSQSDEIGGPPTEGPPEPPMTEEPPPTEPPVVTEKPKKCHCICQWKKCKATVESPEGSKQCYAELRTCTQKKCDTTVCDTALAACQEKGAGKGKHGLKCDKQWKKCFQQHRSQICKKGGHQSDEIGGPPTEGPPEPPMTEEPPPTEPPVTEAPATKAPHTKYKCIGGWKKCLRAAATTDDKRECYAGLKICALQHCDIEVCDTPMTECLAKATEAEKESLRCEKQWKKCFKEHRPTICHK